MSISEDVVDGLVCMKCLVYLVNNSGETNQNKCPTLCYDCWKEAPKKDRNNGLSYFDTDG